MVVFTSFVYRYIVPNSIIVQYPNTTVPTTYIHAGVPSLPPGPMKKEYPHVLSPSGIEPGVEHGQADAQSYQPKHVDDLFRNKQRTS